MHLKISESSTNTAVSLMNVVSEDSEVIQTPQCSHHAMLANIACVSRYTSETSAAGGQLIRQSPQQLRSWFSHSNLDQSAANDDVPQDISAKGAELQRLAEDFSKARAEAQRLHGPVFKLSGKSGWLAGAALATFGIGALAYGRFACAADGTNGHAVDPGKKLIASATDAVSSTMQPESLPIADALWAVDSATPSELISPDDVKITKLDYSCIEERESLTLAEIFRQIGNTLSKPIEELAKEAQVIDYYNNLGRCPDEEEIEFLSGVTSKVDEVVNMLISFVPEVAPAAIIQSIGGSLFVMFADEIAGKYIDMNNIYESNKQILTIAKMIADLTPKDINGQVIESELFLPQHTKLENGDVKTWIDDIKYTINYRDGEYFACGDHGEFPVTYSSKEKSWVLVREEGGAVLTAPEEANKNISPYSAIEDFEIADALKDVQPLDANIFRSLLPNNLGIYHYHMPKYRSALRAIKLNGGFYRVRRGATKKRLTIYAKQELEIALHDGRWYLVNHEKGVEVKYFNCGLKRSPSSLCMSYSQDMDEILKKNHAYGFNSLKLGWLKAEKNNPAILISANNKRYIQHNNVLFKIKIVPVMAAGHKVDSEIRIIGQKRTRWPGRKTNFQIANAYYSESKGKSFLCSKVENIMEALLLPRPLAEAYQSVKEYESTHGQITSDEYASIRAYGGVSYRDINEFIYSGKVNDYGNPALKDTVVFHVKNIRSLLKKLPSLNGVVYRGSSLTYQGIKDLAELKAEDIVSSRKFISASLEPSVADNFAAGPNAVRYKIYVKKAAHPILTFTGKLREAEVLIEDNTVFRCLYIYGRDIVLEEVVNPSSYDMSKLKNIFI